MDVSGVKKNVASIYERRRAAVYAISLKWAAICLNYFRSVQPATPNSQGRFWHNKTAQAAARVFSNASIEGDLIRLFIAHGVSYGVYLELANDRKHEALRPIIQRFAGRYIAELKALYGD